MKHVFALAALAITLGAAPALANNMSEVDSNNDSKISKAEFDSYKDKKFEAADSNKDGSLSSGEFDAMTAKHKDMKDKTSSSSY